MKCYTEQGNYDLAGNNTPVFFIRDPQKFSDFIHSQKRRADTHLHDNNMQWDFWTLSPESAHQVSFLMSDRGTPYISPVPVPGPGPWREGPSPETARAGPWPCAGPCAPQAGELPGPGRRHRITARVRTGHGLH
jgi:hypothetical protein